MPHPVKASELVATTLMLSAKPVQVNAVDFDNTIPTGEKVLRAT